MLLDFRQVLARVRKRRREGNEWAARVGRRYTIQRAIRWLKNRCQVGPQFFSSAPPRSPAPPFDHFPFGPAILDRKSTRLNSSHQINSSPGLSWRNETEE